MKIINQYPPNIEAIRAAFDLGNNKTVFTYGHVLYNPTECTISDNLMCHEKVHEKQQTGFLKSPKKWWSRYLIDPSFRVDQELEAYRAQYSFVVNQVKDRNVLARFLNALAVDLSGPMYGGAISHGEAVKRIRD